MAARRKPSPPPTLLERTPLAEWAAAALGLALTLAVIGYSVWEGLRDDRGPPDLSVTAERPRPTQSGHTTPVVVRNASHATAAAVEVTGVLEQGGRVVEQRRAVFAYVPGKGEARGGLVFERDPSAFTLRVSVEGYEEP